MNRFLTPIFVILLILCGYVYRSELVHIFDKPVAKPQNYHYSYFSNAQFYDDAFAQSKKPQQPAPRSIRGLTVNHHLLAPEIIAGTLQTVATTTPLTVVIISPNHMALGKSDIITSAYDWQTPYGVLEHSVDVTTSLTISDLVNVEEKPFQTEHGITALVAFIKKTLPNAHVVPLIIKDTLPEEKSIQLAEMLTSILPSQSLVIASLDFSHYLPDYISDFHDAKAEHVFEEFDLDAIKALDIDSKPTALTFLTYLKLRGAQKSALLYHTNANAITGHFGSSDNTSYLNFAYGIGKATSTEPAVTMLMFGDMMLDRFVRYQMNAYGFVYPFKNILRFLDGSDIVLANLEGPVTHNPSVTLNFKNKTLQFTFDPAAVPTLKRIGFTTLGLANNHTANFGPQGLKETKEYLASSSLIYYGDPYNKDQISEVQTIRGKKIAFIGYHEFYRESIAPVISEIQRLRSEVDFIVVTPHWGVEYALTENKKQQEKAHAFIDAGADLVLGAHPHVIQPLELYNGKMIFYSLGNFVFDQDFSFDTMHGLSVGLTLGEDNVEYRLFPLSLLKGQVSLADVATREKILTTLSKTSHVGESIKSDIIKGIVHLPIHE